MESLEGDGLPEVREVMEGISGVDEVGWAALVLVGRETRLDSLDVWSIQPR